MKKIKMGAADIAEFMEKVKAQLTVEKGIPDRINLPLNASIKLEKEDKVHVIFDNAAYKKMQALVGECTKEIGWYGVVEHPNEKTYVIKDIIMFPQTVTGATVTTDDEEYNNWLMSVDDEVFNKLRFYGHSHVSFGCTPSGTDDAHYKNMIQNCQDFYIFGIINKRNESWFNIYDIQNNVLYEKDDIVYEYYITTEDEWAKEQINQYVTEHKVTPYQYGGYGNHGYTYGQNYGYGKTAYDKAKEKEKEKEKEKTDWSKMSSWNKGLDNPEWEEGYYD